MIYTLPELQYGYDALEPYIDAVTMETHHSKHHAGYIAKFNAAISGTELESVQLEDLFAKISTLSPAVRNNGGGFYNHSLFWKLLTPRSNEEDITPKLAAAIEQGFGGLEQFKEEFSTAAVSLFGSGWTWLIKTDEGKLAITTTANQDNPLMDISSVKGKPILALDVWEHAYYLKYKNVRPDYIKAFWKIVNWNQVSEYFEE